MKRVEELLLLWEDDEINADQMAELEEFLDDPANRLALYEHFQTTETMQSFFLAEGKEVLPAGRPAPVRTAKKTRRFKTDTRHQTVRVPKTVSSTRNPAVTAPRDRQPAVVLMLAAAAAAVFVIAGAVLLDLSPTPTPAGVGTVAAVRGTVKIVRQGRKLDPGVDTPLQVGDAVIAGDGGAKLELLDGTVVTATPRSHFRIAAATADSGTRLHVERGRIELAVGKQQAGSRFVVEGPHSQATVLGTRFVFDVSELSTRLAVNEGRVQYDKVTEGRVAGTLIVTPGYYAIAGEGIEFVLHHVNEVVARPDPDPDPDPDPEPELPAVAVTGFTLVNADSNKVLRPLRQGDTISLSKDGRRLSICADATEEVLSVTFYLDGEVTCTESVPPFALFGDREEDYDAWKPDVGMYRIRAVPFSRVNGRGKRGSAGEITVKVVN